MPDWKDYRSDTVTLATPAMRRAMMEAEVGDDILREDPTVQRLEETSAALFGKEAGLFVISGTMANQLAVMTLTERGDEVLLGEETHIYNLEVGGLAALSGVQVRALKSELGRFDPEEVRRAIRPKGIQSAVTRLLCLENTYNLNRGIPLPGSYMSDMAELAHEQGLAVYLDGARIFNASVAFGEAPAVLCREVDCLQFCLSKGLAAPIGSLLLGSRVFIDRARWLRQRIGGGMRQAGHMAAAGLVALETMQDRLVEDHTNAKRLAAGLAAIDARLVDVENTLSNIVYVDFAAGDRDAGQVTEALLSRNIRVKPICTTACRMITHWGITGSDVEETLEVFRDILNG
jgi:threonine aldolase